MFATSNFCWVRRVQNLRAPRPIKLERAFVAPPSAFVCRCALPGNGHGGAGLRGIGGRRFGPAQSALHDKSLVHPKLRNSATKFALAFSSRRKPPCRWNDSAKLLNTRNSTVPQRDTFPTSRQTRYSSRRSSSCNKEARSEKSTAGRRQSRTASSSRCHRETGASTASLRGGCCTRTACAVQGMHRSAALMNLSWSLSPPEAALTCAVGIGLAKQSSQRHVTCERSWL